MQQLLLSIHIIIALLIIVLILMQRGKGSDVGAAFGSGASQTVFGSQGSTSFLVKLIAILAALFFVTNLLLGHLIAVDAKKEQTLNTPSVLLQQQSQTPSSNK